MRPTGTEERKFGDLYTSFMDEERIEQLGTEPIAEPAGARERRGQHPEPARDDRQAGASRTRRLLPALRRQRPGQPASGTSSSPSSRASRCPTSRTSGRRRSRRSARRSWRTSSGCSSWPASTMRPSAPQRVYDLEKDIASHHWDNVKSRDSEKTYNLYSWADAEKLFAGDAQDGADLSTWERGARRPRGRAGRGRAAAAVVHRRTREPAHGRPPRELEGLAGLAGRPRVRSLPLGRLRRGELRLLRAHAHRHAADAGAVEARRRAGRGCDGRGRRPHLRRAALPAGVEGEHGCARRQPDRGLPPEHPHPRMDGGGDPRARAREAGEVHAEDRLPGEMARLLERSRSTRPT